MNKGISLAIVGVLLCAMGIIFFMSLSADKDEKQLAQTPQEIIFPEKTTDTNAAITASDSQAGSQPLVADKNASQGRATSSIPPQTTARLDNTPVTPPPVTTPPVKKIEPAKTPAQKTTPPQQKAEPQPTQPQASSDKQPQTPAKTETPAARQETPVKTETSGQNDTQAPSLKPLEPQPTQGPTSTTTATRTPGDGHSLSKIGLHFRGNDIYLRIEADSPFKEKVFTLPGPDRLVVDLMGKWRNVTPPTIPSNQLVTKARVGQQPNATRLVLDLSRKTTFTVHKINDNTVEILMR